jgi:hypothetical protein
MNVCIVCGKEFKSKAGLANHLKSHLRDICDKRDVVVAGNTRTEPVTVRIVVEQASQPRVTSPQYTCPECGGDLGLMLDGPGIYKLKCQKCWKGG